MDLERSQFAGPEYSSTQRDANLDLDAERVLRRRRLLFLYKVSGPAFLFFLVQSLRLELKLGLILNLVALACFALSMRTLFRRDNITKASWYYLLGFSVLIGFTPMIDDHLKSSVIWLLPLIPVIAAHLLGARAVLLVAGGTTLAVIGTWQASLHLEIVREHHFQLFDKVILHEFALLLASGLGLSAVRAAKQQIEVIQDQEEELHRAQGALESARQAKAMFLANMSHEIRTPLNGILGMTEILASKELEKEDKLAVQGAHDCGQQLLALLNGVLDLSKLEAGKFGLRQELYSSSEIEEELESRYLEKFRSKGMEFRLERGPQGVELLGDRARVVQVLSVFLQNALQFSESSRVQVSSRIEQGDQGQAWLWWTIEDNGVGMGQELLDQVLAQASQSLTCPAVGFHGAGLGIDLATKLAARMGGELKMESELGQGVQAQLRLPLQRGDRRGQTLSSFGADAPAQPSASLRVLLVDDNQINRTVALRLLSKFNCVTSEATNGAQALELAQEPFDLIFMDLQMPVMDGLTAASKIREGRGPNQDTPIVALTAGDFEDDQSAREQAGMTDFLSKPIEPYALERILRAQGWAPAAKAS